MASVVTHVIGANEPAQATGKTAHPGMIRGRSGHLCDKCGTECSANDFKVGGGMRHRECYRKAIGGLPVGALYDYSDTEPQTIVELGNGTVQVTMQMRAAVVELVIRSPRPAPSKTDSSWRRRSRSMLRRSREALGQSAYETNTWTVECSCLQPEPTWINSDTGRKQLPLSSIYFLATNPVDDFGQVLRTLELPQ